MTVLFIGSEREALQQGVSGSYFETGSGGSADTRATSGCNVFSLAGNYDCELAAASPEIWATWKTFNVGAGNSTHSVYVMDSALNVLARVVDNGGNFVLQYWDGATYVPVTTVATSRHSAGAFTLHVKKGASGTGQVEFFKDGVLLADSGGITLTSFGDIEIFRLRADDTLGISSARSFSDVVVTDTVSTLAWGSATLVPSADGTDTDGIGVVGDVNELNLNEATYITLSNAGDKRSFVNAAPDVENYVKGVAVAGRLRRVDGTGPQQVRPYLIIGGVRYYGTTFALTTAFVNYEHVWSLSPASGTDWTTAEVNDPTFQMGWEAVA